ncbi:MAG: diaminopimelate decarboxylase [Acidobacteriia bacterium]|nr:diaminopimelate decarboxylase [Terriglobia bacterium]
MSKSAVPEGRPPAFVYRRDVLHCERAPLPELAQKHGTPLYVYSATTIRDRYRTFDRAFRGFPHTVCYSVKANSNLALLKMLAGLGCGFDVVSGGELRRVLRAARTAARRVVFSGVGMTAEEMDAALRAGILMFNVESESEMAALAQRCARLKKTARLAFRVNPDVPAETHPYIATGLHQHKFGVPIDAARRLYERAAQEKWLEVAGVSVHIGSQITSVEPFGMAMERVAELVRALKSDGHRIRYVDAGGGLGIRYDAQELPEFAEHARDFARAVTRPLRRSGVHLLLEPGRAIVGPAGALLVRVLYRKSNNGKSFVVVDAAMNDLIRPALYGAHHEIVPVERTRVQERDIVDVVGPICETGDFFARDRALPPVEEGGLLAILDTGAYGMSISSNYNTRPRAAEVLVEGKKARVIRKRETVVELLRNERL